MRLSTKIYTALAVLYGCIACIGLLSLGQINAINGIYSFFSEEWFPSSALAQKLNILTSEFRRYETIHVYSEDPQVMANYEQSMVALGGQIAALTEEYKKSARPGALARAQDLEDRWKHYMAADARVLALSTDLRTSDAVAMLMGDSRERYNEYNLILKEIVSSDMAEGARASEQGSAKFRWAWNLISVMLAAMLGLAVFMGICIVRATLRHLGKDPGELSVLARKVAKGQHNLPDDPKATGVYADILALARRLGDQIQSLEALTSNIPGGVKTCLLDEGFTITWVSDGFVNMLGYSREEMREKFNSQYVLMVPEAERRKSTALMAQLENGETFEWEHRLQRKDGSFIWVLDKGRRVRSTTGGEDQLFCVLLDISELAQTRNRLKMQEEQCLAALCATNDFVFESDPFFSFVLHKGAKTWQRVFGRMAVSYADAFSLTAAQCHPDDLATFEDVFAPDALLRKIQEGVENVRMEYRLFHARYERYVWLNCTIVPFTDVNGRLIKLFDCLVDVDERKQHERKMLDSAQKDSLTDLFNKAHAEEEIAWVLSQSDPGSSHALYVVDIDDFKAVNDNLGHLFGDAVLVDVAASIRRSFRSSDVAGRIGGDEFVILLKDVASETLLRNKAQELCNALHRTFDGKDRQYSISGSVGVARYPQDGTSYRELFQKADAALYEAKRQGKGRYFVHSDGGVALAVAGEGLTAMAARAESKTFKEDVLSYIFELFYEAKDIKTIVNIALGMVGQHYGLSRAYVFLGGSDDKDGAGAKGAAFYEWHDCNVAAMSARGETRPYTCIPGYVESYASDGTLHCDNTFLLQKELAAAFTSHDTHSCLHVAIYDEGRIKGYVGFDECNENRRWSREELATLATVAKIVGIFLLKDSISRQVAEAHEKVCAVLDGLNIWAYVIDPVSHAMLYLNHNTKLLLPEAAPGLITCHAALFNSKKEMCDFCPLLEMKPEDQFHSKEIYNPYLNIWMLSTVSRITWSGKEAMLVCSLDVSDYKHGQVRQAPGH